MAVETRGRVPLWRRISEALGVGRQPASELLGRTSVKFIGGPWASPMHATVDHTRPDYAYWDRLRRGKQPTVKIGGMFADPTTSHKKNWSLGKGFTARTGHEATDEALDEFVRKSLRALKDAYKNGLDLGDAYIVVNPDGSLTEVAPDAVEPVHDDMDFRKVIAYRIVTRGERVTTTDEYRLDGRTVTIEAGGTKTVKTYRNLIGRLPVCHYANRRSVNEVYGHPEVEAMLPAMMEYDDVILKGLAGVKTMSVPMPALEGVENTDAALRALGATQETYKDVDGTERTTWVVDFEQLPFILTPGTFNFKGPQSFTDDMWRVLKNLFYLMLQNGSVPEFIWGGAIQGSKASVEAQMPGWEMVIEDQRSSIEDWLTAVCETWLAIRALSDRTVRALPVSIDWPEVTEEGAADRRAAIDLALRHNLITAETALDKLQLVEDAAAEVEKARAEAEARQAEFNRLAGFEDEPDTPDDDTAPDDAGDDDDSEDAAA